jgi:hypothetical protein
MTEEIQILNIDGEPVLPDIEKQFLDRTRLILVDIDPKINAIILSIQNIMHTVIRMRRIIPRRGDL